AHVVGLAMIFGHDFVNIFSPSTGILAGCSQASSLLWQLIHKLSDLRNRILVVLHSIMRYSRKFIVRARAAERLVIDCLTGRAFDQVRSTQTHERSAFYHDDDV